MTEIFGLGFKVDSKPLAIAKKRMDELAASAAKVYRAMNDLDFAKKLTNQIKEQNKTVERATKLQRDWGKALSDSAIRDKIDRKAQAAEAKKLADENIQIAKSIENIDNVATRGFAKLQKLYDTSGQKTYINNVKTIIKLNALKDAQYKNTPSTWLPTQDNAELKRMSSYYADLNKEINANNKAMAGAEKGLLSYTRNVKTVEGAVESYRLKIQALKADYNTLASVQGHTTENLQHYRQSVAAARIEKERSLAKIDAYNKMLGMTGTKTRLARHELLNLSYQLQDVVVGLASGQRPMTVLIQQGSQIAGIAASAGLGLRGMASAMLGLVGSVAKMTILNPIVLALGLLTGAIVRLQQNISKGTDVELKKYAEGLGLTAKQVRTLKDVHVTAMDSIKGFFMALGEQIGFSKDWFSGLTKSVGSTFDWLLTTLRNSFVGLYAVFTGTFNAMVYTLHQLPYMIGDAFMLGLNGAIKGLEWFANKGIDLINYLGGSFERVKLGQLANPFRGEIRGVVDTFMEEGTRAQNEANKFIDNLINNTKKYGMEVAKARILKQAQTMIEDNANKEAESRAKIIARTIKGLKDESDSLRALTDAEQAQLPILRLNNELQSKGFATLKKTEQAYKEITGLIESNKAWEYAKGQFEEINNAALTYNHSLSGLKKLKEQGKITDEQYSNQLTKLNIALEQASDPMYSLTQAINVNKDAIASGNIDLEREIQLINLKNQLLASGQASTYSDEELARMLDTSILLDKEVTARKDLASANLQIQDALLKIKVADTMLAEGKIGVGQYTTYVNDLYKSIANLKLAMGEGTMKDSMLVMVDDFGSGFTNVLDGLTKNFSTFFTTLRDGFADSIGQAIVDGKNLGDMFRDLGKSAIKELISGLVRLAVQYVVVGEAAAVAGVANQAQGDPYTAFGRMATMAGIMAGLGLMSGGLSSSGSTATTSRLTGTVLGYSNEQSESIANAVQITADATTALVGINRRMLTAMSNLADALGGVSDILVRYGVGDISGGLKDNTLTTRGLAMATGATAAGMSLAASFGTSLSTMLGAAGTSFGLYASAALAIDKLMDGLVSSMITRVIAFMNKVPIVGNITSAIFGEMKVTEIGLRIADATFTELMNGVNAWTYQHASSSGLFGGSSDATQALGTEASNQISLIFQSMGDTIKEASTILGMNIADIEQKLSEWRLGETITIALKDLDASEQADAISAVFSNIFDSVASYVAGDIVAQYQKAGEGMAETLVRVATNVLYVDEYLNRFGKDLYSLGGNFIEISNWLVEAAGDYETLGELQSTFFSKFYTEAEQFSVLTGDLTRVTSQLGTTLPENRTMWRDMVNAIDITTEAGAGLYVTLLNLSDTADAYYTYIEDAQEKAYQSEMDRLDRLNEIYADVQNAVDEAINKLSESISAEKDRIQAIYDANNEVYQIALDALKEKQSEWQGVIDTLSGALNSLIGNMEDATGAVRRQAQAQLQSYISVVRSGGSISSDALGTILDTLQQDSAGLFSSFEDYVYDYWKTAQDIKTLSTLSEDQLSSVDQSILLLEDQIAQNEKWYNDEITRLDNMLTLYQTQVDVMRGVDNSVKDLTTAINTLMGAIAAEQAVSSWTGVDSSYSTSTTASQSAINALYKQYLGREAEAAGMAYWDTLYNTGALTLSQIEDFIANSPEALDGSHAGGLSFVPFDGYRAELHKGEKVLTATEAKEYDKETSSMNNKDIIAELKALRTEMTNMVKIQQQWDRNGLPAERNYA